MADKTILATMTGEHLQPVRLHYQVFDREALLRTFKTLRCVKPDPSRPRWAWLYDQEAGNLSLKVPRKQIPAHLQPVIIGSLWPREDRLLLDLRSCERAILAIPFFDKHIPRSTAKVTEAEVVNKLFTAEDGKITPEQIFDRQESTAFDAEAALKEMGERIAKVGDPLEKVRMAAELVFGRAKQQLPEIERFPVNYYEDGIQPFTTALTVRQVLAYQHWLGNTSYSMYDVIQSMTEKRK